MGRPRPVTYRGQVTGVGTTAVAVVLDEKQVAGAWVAGTPPKKGTIGRHQVLLDAGPATDFTLIQFLAPGDAAGSVKIEYQNEAPDLDKPSIQRGIWYETTSALGVEVTTDDGTNSSNITVLVEVEAP